MKTTKYDRLILAFIKDRDNGTVLSFDEFVQAVDKVIAAAPAEWRRGQAVYNTAQSMLMPTVNLSALVATDIDPFYKDENIEKFLEQVYDIYVHVCNTHNRYNQDLSRCFNYPRNFSFVMTGVAIVLFVAGAFFDGDARVILWTCSFGSGLFSSWLWNNFIVYNQKNDKKK